jgi:hypothetical protein
VVKEYSVVKELCLNLAEITEKIRRANLPLANQTLTN